MNMEPFVMEPTRMPARVMIADLALEPAVMVPPELAVRQVARMLAEANVATVLVDANPMFELVDRDIVRAFAAGVDPGTPAGDMEHGVPEFVAPGAHVAEVASMMLATGRRELVVVDGMQVCGVVQLTVVTTALWGPTSLVGALRVALQARDGWE